MSRRLETISTGFVDVSKGIDAFNTAYAQSKRIQLEEEDRQRRLQEQEDARLALGQQVYMNGMSALDKSRNGLTTEEKAVFVDEVNQVKNKYINLQEQIAKGVKPGSPTYLKLQEDIYNSQTNLDNNISNLKLLKESQKAVLIGMKNGLEVEKSVVDAIDAQTKAIMSKQDVSKLSLVTPESVQLNSYKPAMATINQFANMMPTTTQYLEEINPTTNKKETKTSVIPTFSGSYVAAANLLANIAPRDAKDITNNLNEWKVNNPEDSPQYKYYLAWMDNDKVKEDQQHTPPKAPSDFSEYDFIVMSALSKKYIPSQKEMSKVLTSGQKKDVTNDIFVNNYMSDLYSGDDKKISSALYEIKSALKPSGWNITRTGSVVKYTKAKDEWGDAINETFDLADPTQKTAALTFINKVNKAIGKSGAKYLNKQ